MMQWTGFWNRPLKFRFARVFEDPFHRCDDLSHTNCEVLIDDNYFALGYELIVYKYVDRFSGQFVKFYYRTFAKSQDLFNGHFSSSKFDSHAHRNIKEQGNITHGL